MNNETHQFDCRQPFYLKLRRPRGLRRLFSWIFSPLTRGRDIARERRALWGMLGILLETGTPILMAFKVCAESARFRANRKLVVDICESVKEGNSIVEVLEERGIAPIESMMIAVGEQAGSLPEVLLAIEALPDSRRFWGDPQLVLVSLLETLLSAGLPLGAALKTLSRSCALAKKTRLTKIIAELSRDVDMGTPLFDSLKKVPEFDAFTVAAVRAGELSGRLDLALRCLRGAVADCFSRSYA